jgi:hypothetical protein
MIWQGAQERLHEGLRITAFLTSVLNTNSTNQKQEAPSQRMTIWKQNKKETRLHTAVVALSTHIAFYPQTCPIHLEYYLE